MQPTRVPPIAQRRDPDTKKNHEHGGRQREAECRHEAARQLRLAHAQDKGELSARWPGQELAQGHQVGISRVAQPLPAMYKFIAEIAQMSYRPAKGGQP